MRVTAMEMESRPRESEAEKLLPLLMAEVDKVEAFKGKWSLIRPKLANLPTQLNSLSDSAGSLPSELLRSVLQTLSQTLTLAVKCSTPNPPDGKLRTQSDLASLSARLDQHIHDATVLTRSLNLSGDSTRCLLTRLQIGSSESRISAMDSVLSFLNEGDDNVSLAVEEGLVAALLDSLDSSSPEIREKAVAAISRVSSTPDGRKNPVLSKSPPLIAHLLRALDSRNGFAREKACVALQSLTFSPENAAAVVGFPNGISLLLEVCRSGTPYSQANAAGALRNISCFPETRRFFFSQHSDSDAIEVLIAAAGSGTFIAQGNSIACLNNLLLVDESLSLMVAKESAIVRCLKSFWDSAPLTQSLEVAIELSKTLALRKSSSETLVSEGFLPRLKAALSCEISTLRIMAAETICELGSNGSRTRREIGEFGILTQLVSMLCAKLDKEKEIAARGLSVLLICGGNRKMFLREDKGIECTVKLLDPLVTNVDKKYLVSILSSVVNSSSACRRQIVDSGGLGHLQKLIESGVDDGAKKLRESLDRDTRTWGVFSRRK